jgi:hypothetical protein
MFVSTMNYTSHNLIGPRTLRWSHPIDVNNGEKFYVVE